MKRQIVCKRCVPKVEAGLLVQSLTSDERTTLVDGFATTEFVCDDCGIQIEQGDHCTATTTIRDGESRPAWEPEYLDAAHPRGQRIRDGRIPPVDGRGPGLDTSGRFNVTA